jgi:hypothetical protein
MIMKWSHLVPVLVGSAEHLSSVLQAYEVGGRGLALDMETFCLVFPNMHACRATVGVLNPWIFCIDG